MIPAIYKYTVNQIFCKRGHLGIQPQIKKVEPGSISQVFIVILDMFKQQYFYYEKIASKCPIHLAYSQDNQVLQKKKWDYKALHSM